MARNELGVPYEDELPYYRVGNQIADFMTYPQLNKELKEGRVSQGLAAAGVSSHGLRGGGSKDIESACGGRILQV